MGAYCFLLGHACMRKAVSRRRSSSRLHAGWFTLLPAQLLTARAPPGRVCGSCEGMENDLIAALFSEHCGEPSLPLSSPCAFQLHDPPFVV